VSPAAFQTTRFLTLAQGEEVAQEYYVRRSDRRILTGKFFVVCGAAIVASVVVLGMMFREGVARAERLRDDIMERMASVRRRAQEQLEWVRDPDERREIVGWRDREIDGLERDLEEASRGGVHPGVAAGVVLAPLAVVVLFFLLRHRPNSKGYLVLTNRRVVYYEYDEHPRENYRYVSEARLPEVTGIHLGTGRKLLTRYMYLIVTTKRYAPICVSAVGGVSAVADLLRTDASPANCVPADDAIQCVQELGGRIRALQAAVTAPTAASRTPSTEDEWAAPPPPPPPKPTTAPIVPSGPVSKPRAPAQMTCASCGMGLQVSGAPGSTACPHCGSWN
jgi:hypothetical protein